MFKMPNSEISEEQSEELEADENPQDAKAHNSARSAHHDAKSDFVQLGGLLASSRRKIGLTKEQIVDKIKITEANLDAIERGDIDSITMPMPFLRGFLREYCTLLKAENIWREYDRITASRTITKLNNSNVTKAEQKEYGLYNVDVATPRSRVFIISFLVLVALLVVFVAYQLRKDIASQALSPESIVMGLNPFDKMQSDEEDKNASSDLVPPDSDSDDTASQTSNTQEQVADSGEQTNATGEPQKTEESQDASKEGLPTDSSSFGWLDKKEEALSSKNEVTKPLATDKPDLPPAQKRTVTIKAVNVLWVRVSTPNRRIFQGLMKKGEVRTYEVGAIPIIVRYGKGSQALVTWNGVERLVSNEPNPITVTYTTDAR